MVRSTLGAGRLELACELRRFSGLMAYEEAEAIRLIDPAPRLGLPRTQGGRVGLLELAGPPRGVCLGALRSFETWDASRVMVLPDWLGGWLPPGLKRGVGLGEAGQVVWMLDLDWLARHG